MGVKDYHNGFTIPKALLVLTAIVLIVFGSWLWIRANETSHNPIDNGSGVNKKSLDSRETDSQNSAECTENGIIIVMFNSGTPKDRQEKIIATENASVSRHYGELDGYALNVQKGMEQEAVDDFLKYPEVDKASLNNGCEATNSTQ